MEESKLPSRIAIIGLGAVTELYYAPALKYLENRGDVVLQMLFDPSQERVATLRKIFPKAAAVKDLDEITATKCDLAIVASPARYHCLQATKMLSAGISVLCEKPMATSISECDTMIKASADAEKPLAVGLMRRFLPATQWIKTAVSLELLGPVISFHLSECVQFAWPAKSSSLFQRQHAAGGVLLDLGVHAIDLMQWWFGCPDDISYADDSMGGIESNCQLQVKYKKGISGRIRLSRDWNMNNRYVIVCEKGEIAWTPIDPINLELTFASIASSIKGSISNLSFQQCFIEQISNALAASRGKEAVLVTGKEASESIRIIEKCYAARSLLDMPWLTDQELEQARSLNRYEIKA